MAVPTEKHHDIENLINALNPTGHNHKKSITNNTCSWCGKPATNFRDTLSAKEYTISGFCQSCQDKTFGTPEDEDELPSSTVHDFGGDVE